MATAMGNNVVMRYASYVYRFVNTRLLPMELRRLGVQSLSALPPSQRSEVLVGINAVKRDIETRRHPKLSPDRFHAWINQHVDDLVRPKPLGRRGTTGTPLTTRRTTSPGASRSWSTSTGC